MRLISYKLKLISLIVIIVSTLLILVGASIIDKPLQYKITFEGKEKTILCTKNKDGVLMVPLNDLAGFIGLKVEPCDRCGKDEVYDENDKSKNGKGHLYVNWYKNIITYSNDAAIISLDAVNDKYNDGITYTSLQLYKYLGFNYTVDDSNKNIAIKAGTAEAAKSSPSTSENNLKKDLTSNTAKADDEAEPTSINDNELTSNDEELSKDNQVESTNTMDTTEITYVYEPGCTSCEEISKLLDKIESTGKVHIQKINGAEKENKSIIDNYNSKCNALEDIRDIYPVVFIDDQYLFDVEINETNIEELLSNKPFTHNFKNDDSIQTANSNEAVEGQPQENKEKVLIYFYSSTCASCKRAENYIDDLKKKYSDIKVINYNLNDEQNIKLLGAYGEKYNLDKNQINNIPAIFLSQTALVGDSNIINMLEDKIENYDFDNPTEIIDLNEIGNNTSVKDKNTLQLITIALAGIVNGINPCSLSMFLFLMSIVNVTREKILKIGFLFCFGKFITFFLLGTFLYKALSFINISMVNIIEKIVLIIVISIFIILNLNDFIAARMEKYDKMILQLPSKLKKLNHKLMKRVTSCNNSKYFALSILMVGMIIALGEFMCTGQIYLISIVFLVQNNGIDIKSVFYLLIYSVAFVLPIIIVTILIYYGKKVFNLSELLLKRLPNIKIISSLIFIIFGIYIIFFT